MKIIHLSSIDSTNTYLKKNYLMLDNFTFVSADEQSEGRGRLSRIWKSENGKNLLFSLLILDKELIKHYKEISIVSAYSIVEVLKDLGLKDLSIKWPNDVFVKDKKISGILLEAVSKSEIECLIVGIGLNVNQINFDNDFINKATSIKLEIQEEIIIDELKIKIYNQLFKNLNALINYDFYHSIIKYDYLKGKIVSMDIKGTKKDVEVIGINKDYSLCINDDGKIIDISSGEASLHRD